MSVVRALLGSIIDYAGLFPPAGLEMEPSVRNYAAYRSGSHRWMLGSFVLPVSRLGEFERAAEGRLDAQDPWPLTVLGGPDPGADLRAILEFRRRRSDARIESVEIKSGTSAQIQEASRIFGGQVTVFYEIPTDGSPGELLGSIRDAGGRAKIRTGGTSPGMVPAVLDLARFLCAAIPGTGSPTPFKATAGLHHPIRSVHPLTYLRGCESDLMHGFLNLFIAAAFAAAKVERWIPQVLDERDARNFTFRDRGISWKDHTVGARDVETARRIAGSFGSCSFDEPVRELAELGVL